MFLLGSSACLTVYIRYHVWSNKVVGASKVAHGYDISAARRNVEMYMDILNLSGSNAILCSILRMENLSISLVLGTTFFLLGTFLERLKGPAFTVLFFLAATVTGNAVLPGVLNFLCR